ncbi:carboxymuconolactone decarboxylase family protein [Paractinoplanes lichenicola]|uniref:Carboxymuconolactone decarboxylase family protein n=1 Tax=Paractinoplanes lichenicola TaxID=2802976 RepID=A0ABS1VU76_9ACTN|nr:carboxymuconolactone decarboxylase family protein [Actinoplanes lichenicola]MBL7257997.1 carboxymuconolactone decarboxylase family protein [Actinoplanes lichenicola]
MAYIDLGVDETREPGIRGLLRYRPSTGKPLSDLAEALLRGDSPLTRGEREYIAAYVSALNDCAYCTGSHGAVAAAQGMPSDAPVSDKLRALLAIAAAAASGGHAVTPALIADARATDATDLEIHDTVLLAAAFSMFNRYVDGLGTVAPSNPKTYEMGAARIVAHGYSS